MTTINTLVTVNTTEKWDRRLKNSVFIRAFSPTIDEPKNIGGSNGGPNPVEYVLAAIIYLYIYYNRICSEWTKK